MYKFTRDFLEYLADKLQIGERKPDYGVWVYKKDKSGGYYPAPITFGPRFVSIEMDRRYNMSTDELTITLSNVNGVASPDYTTKKEELFTAVEGLPLSGWQKALEPFNKIKVNMGYGNQTVQVFVGQIMSIDIQEEDSTIKLTCQNELRKLLKPIDPINTRSLKYEKQRAIDIITDLCKRAGLPQLTFEVDEVNKKDYEVPKAEFELGLNYKDAIDSILSTMGHRIYADRMGLIRIVKLENYSQKDIVHWTFDDYIDLTQGSYTMDALGIRNRVIVQGKTAWEAYEDPFLIKFCNNEKIAMGVEVPWAETSDQKKTVANDLFIQMRRKFRRITLATVGNPTMDVGDLALVKMLTSTATAKYMITGIKTSFTDGGYFDIVDLEFVVATEDVAVKAEGDYTPPPTELPDDINDPIYSLAKSTLGLASLRDAICQEARWYASQGTPYKWGGGHDANKDSDWGYDCSGIVARIFRKFGVMKPGLFSMRARDFKSWCTRVTDPTPGDLAFYSNSSGIATHVGIYLGNGKVMSASGGGPSTTSPAIARRQNAKAKIHNANYDRSRALSYGTPPTYESASLPGGMTKPVGTPLVVEATAYDPSPEQNGGYGGLTALGTKLRWGVIATDPSVIPLRTKVHITYPDGTPLGTFVAEDTGGAIKGNKIDILYLTNAEALQFGRRKMHVYILG